MAITSHQVEERLNWLGRLIGKATNLDDWLKLLVQLQMEQFRFLAGGIRLRAPEIATDIPSYNVRKYPLDTAKTTSDPEEVVLSGDTLTFYTDGSLEGIQLALDLPTNDWVPINEFGNPYHYPGKFKKFYLAWTAQTGKYLRVHIGREAGAEAFSQLTLPSLTADTSVNTLDRRVNLDALQSIQLEHRLGRKLNDFFNGRKVVSTVESRIDVDDYWANDVITLPSGEDAVAIYSRKVSRYPILTVVTKFPAVGAGTYIYLGLESGADWPAGLIALLRHSTSVDFIARAPGFSTTTSLTNLLPDGYDTTEHRYTIKLNKCNAELFIDGALKAIYLIGVTEDLPDFRNVNPYAMYLSPNVVATEMTTLLELTKAGGGISYELKTSLNNFVVFDGDPLPPRQYAIYTANTSTKWNGLATAAAITSHPIPVWGYERKTLLFQSNAAGTLSVQIYTGGAWRQLTSITLVANTLSAYDMTAEAPIARTVYTNVGADTIAVAEWHLS